MCPARVNVNSGRGFIIPIGGGEDRVKERQIHRRFVELSGGKDADIVVIPTASELETTGQDYNRIFRDLGAAEVDFLPITRRADCDNPRYEAEIGHIQFAIGAGYSDPVRYPIDFFLPLDDGLHIVPGPTRPASPPSSG